ncbi:hypothetical protein HIM_04066 [Hirsutella minnesotensis 3608]|uniref:Terpene synthase metal-binding domain-containing protein n=1 Tax=Hirsutella minnesotensis 3608 TaxID=1043627 RepID=A0A0F7ZQ69_9HYPO|nr:hypothetical protein HIM_04066 [Hirsutella minnesotensis 3608]
MDFGTTVLPDYIRFLMEIDLTEAEAESFRPVEHYATAAIVLANDYWSWPKEKAGFKGSKDTIWNLVTLLMRLRGVQEQEAREMVKGIAIEYEERAIQMCYELVAAPGSAPSDSFRRFVHAYLLLMAGNNFWHATSPRYEMQSLV